MGDTWAARIEIWNQMIRAGRGGEITRELVKIPRVKIPLDQLAKIANVCWRVGQPGIGLRLLFPELRRQAHRRLDVPPEALAEYASCLQAIGATGEAKMLLNATQSNVPRAKFYLALLLLKEWDYAGALSLLENYLAQIPSDYHATVVRVNLAATYVMNRQFDKADETLAALRPELEKSGHKLLLGNCYEIESQIHYESGRHAQALRCLEKSEAHLGQSNNVSWIFCKKWQFLNRILVASRPPDDPELVCELAELRTRAAKMASWETIRDLDLHWALFARDQNLLNRVFFGTPITRYRERLEKRAADAGLTLPETANFTSGAVSPLATYDLRAEEFMRGEDSTFLLKKLLLILASDFYAPFRTGQVYSQLFENEYYNIETSQVRISQLVHRLRRWLGKENWRAQVGHEEQGYRLVFQPGSRVIMDRHLPGDTLHDKTSVNLALVKREFGTKEFSAARLSKHLRCSKRSANRILHELHAGALIERLGSGPATRFKIAG